MKPRILKIMDIDLAEVGITLADKLRVPPIVTYRDSDEDLKEHLIEPCVIQEYWDQDILELTCSELNKVNNIITRAAKYDASYIRFVSF